VVTHLFHLRNLQFQNHWKKGALIFTLFCIIVSLFFFRSTHEAPAIPNKQVEIEVVKLQDIQNTIRLLGTIHPQHAAVLISKGSGILDALIPTGQKIKKGALIAKIDNVDVEKNLQLSTSAEVLAKAQLDRFSPLVKTGFVSSKEIEEKKQAWIDAQKELSKAKIELDNLRFYAPFDGIIGAYKKREGAQVNSGEAVVAIYDPSSLVVDFDIPCSTITTVNEGQPVSVLGKQYTLTHVQKMLDDDSHMCPGDVTIKCDQCLIGSTVDVDLVVAEKKKTIVVPFQALFLKESLPFVYVVLNKKVTLIAVKTGLKQKDQIEIIEGLKPGQQLIIKGQSRLYPEMPVDIYPKPN
jgi:membrane fusion protein (multidrug efflux system)